MSITLSKIGVIVGAILVVLMIILALCASILTEYDPFVSSMQDRFSPPSQQHPFGTDNMGRDIQSRIFHGLRTTLGVSFLAVLIALVLGGALGLLAGAFDGVISRSVILLARFLSAGPGILLVIVSYRGGLSALNLALRMPVVLIPGFVRAFSGLKLCQKGNNTKKPLGMVIAQISLSMALAVFVCAVISYIGLGIPAPSPEFGALIAVGRDHLRNAPWMVVYPGLALAFAALSFNILGESLNALLLKSESELLSKNGAITQL